MFSRLFKVFEKNIKKNEKNTCKTGKIVLY